MLDTDYSDAKYKKLTEKIIKIFYKFFENTMMIEFKRDDILAVSQSGMRVFCENKNVGEYFLDILIYR
jgi:hypothetical protein